MNSSVKVPSNFYPIVKWASIFIIIGGIKLSTPIFLPLFIALFISITLSHPINWLEKNKVPHNLAVVTTLVVFFGLSYLMMDIIGKNIAEFVRNFPFYKEKLDAKFAGIKILDELGIDLNASNLSDQDTGKLMGYALTTLSSIKRIVGQVVFITILTLFMVFELDSFPFKFRAIFGSKSNLASNKNYDNISNNIQNYLGIKTFTSLATGTIIYVILRMIGVEYAILWAMIAFVMNFVPNIGSMIAAVPAILFSWIQLGDGALVLTGLTYLFVNMIIGSILEPKIMGKGMGLSTFVVFLSLIFWGWIMGPIGMFLSVPLTMTLKILLETSESSKYFAILLGTKKEAMEIINTEERINVDLTNDP